LPTIHHGDCIETMNAMPPESVDAIVTDPPYGLGFMGRKWDALPPSQEWAEACYRVLKPGGHIAAFGGTRTWHRLAVAIEDAGFEMRDSLAWLYGSGFPKSMNVGKAIDKAREDSSEWRTIGQALRSSREAAGYRTRRAFAPLILDGHKNLESAAANLSNWENGLSFPTWERWESLKAILSLPDDMDAEVLRLNGRKGEWGDERPDRVVSGPSGNAVFQPSRRVEDAGTPATPEAAQWDGWGTALKPGHEPVVVARKPHAISGILDGIGSELDRLEDECRPSANGAARSSAPTPAASPEVRTATAPESAATPHEGEQARTTPTGAAAGSSAATDTSAFESEGETCWSTVTSWRACWAELCELTSTSTTSTASSLTTDLRTLWSSIASLTATSTPGSPTSALTSPSTASAVDSLFAATVLRLRATLALSATESATASTPPAPQGGAEGSPAFEPIVLARKPLAEKTVARNVLAHGTGAINVDACRIAGDMSGGTWGAKQTTSIGFHGGTEGSGYRTQQNPSGRWPANVLLDHHAAAWVDEQSGVQKDGVAVRHRGVKAGMYGPTLAPGSKDLGYGGGGGASRFFYVAKAPKSERPNVDGVQHPTVKPLAIMRWLIRLVTPPGGVVLDPFAGSGTTIEAALIEGFEPIGIEMETEYLPLIQHRIDRQAGTLPA